MTGPDGFDRLLTTWLEEQAPMREPDDLLRTVEQQLVRTRRLPSWVLLERWLPMQTQARLGAIPRSAIILVTLGLLAALLTAIAMASQPGPTFTIPGSGVIVINHDSDLLLHDVSAGTTRPLVTGPENDGQQTLTDDGTQVIFTRAEGDGSVFWIADVATGEARELASGRVFSDITDWWPSHDGRFVGVAAPDGATDNLTLIPTDGTGERALSLGMITRTVDWTPDDQQIYFGRFPTGPTAQGAELYSVPADGGPATMLVYSTGGLRWPSISPDGKRIGYGTGDSLGSQDGPWRIYVADADGTDARRVEATPEDDSEDGPWWSPDGTRLAIVAGDGPHRIGIVPVDGDAPPVLSEPIEGATSLYPVWAPDGTSLLIWRESDGVLLPMEAATGALTPTGLTSTDWPTWQRPAR